MAATLSSPAAEQRIRQLQEAVRADPANPALRWSLGHALLAAGRYPEGWPLLEARKELEPDHVRAPTADLPEWRGEPIPGRTLLIASEQGFGDQIMMARFAPVLRARGAKVVMLCLPQVARLFAPLADAVVGVSPGATLHVPAFDCWTHYFSLPWLLGITAWNVPGQPYLRAPAPSGGRPSGAGGVGLMWRSDSPAAANKNLPEALASELLARGLVSLQPEDTGAKDFADTAAIIERLSLVVTTDTAVAHLAGAMGKPVWVMVSSTGSDWRWGREGETTPWYPTARLFRQGEPGDWTHVVAGVRRALGPP